MVRIKFVTLWISGICIAVFIFQLLIPGFTDFFFLSENALTMPWQFLTAVFLHGNLTHLIYNLFALIMFGLMLENLIGSKKYLWIFLISGVLANVISFAFGFSNALGASGAIMAVIGCLAILKPMMSVWVFGMIMPMSIAAVIWLAIGIFGIFGLGESGIGHLAHVSGLVLGVIYGFFLRLGKRSQKKPFVIYSNKITLPENYMRSWEDRNMR